MKNFYGVLEIEATALKTEIKRAYFKSVRKFQPERYPKEFMEIREAYETLYDESRRSQYDNMVNMPAIVSSYYEAALAELQQDNPTKSIKLLEKVTKVYPCFSIINALLGDAYIANENTGKAIKIFEKLVEQEPKNSAFAGKLANSYFERGWHNKAIDKYNFALKLDEDNISLWLALISCYMQEHDLMSANKIIHLGLQTSIKNDWDGTELYFNALHIDLILEDLKTAKKHMTKLQALANKDDISRSNVAWFLAHLSEIARSIGRNDFYKIFIALATKILPEDVDLTEFKEKEDKEAEIDILFEQLDNDDNFDELLYDALDFFNVRCEDPECGECVTTRLNYEIGLATEMKSIKPQLIKLKREYPKLYDLNSSLFDEILATKNTAAYYNKHNAQILSITKKFKSIIERKYNESLCDEEGEDTEDEFFSKSEPVLRDENKVGRNDPCPCGSGKKYKKCCGK
ncbi:MAG TPA: DnaJ domain-containing protein [Ruminiclostridium sp.]